MRYALLILSGMLVDLWLAASSTAQPLTMTQADSLRRLLQTNQADTNRVGALLGLSGHYQGRTLNYLHNLDTALVLVNQAQALSQQLHYVKGQQEALFQQARIFIKQEKLDKVKQMLPGISSILRIRLLLELGKNKLNPTYSQEANLDSALLYFNQAERLSNQIGNQSWQQESQLLIGVAYVFKQDCKTGQAWFRRVIESHHRANDQAGELRAWLRWIIIKSCKSVCVEDSTEFTKALTLTRQLGDKSTEVLLLLHIGYNHLFVGNNLKQVVQEALEALNIQKAIGYRAVNRAYHALVAENDFLASPYLGDLMSAYCLWGGICIYNNRAKEVFYYLELIKDLEHNGLQGDLDWPFFWLGNIYQEQRQYAKSLAYYQQSLAVSHGKGEVVVYVGLIRHMAESLLNLGKARQAIQVLENFSAQHLPLDYTNKMNVAVGLGQCYTTLKQYRRAEQYYLEAVALSRVSGLKINRVGAGFYISDFYVATAQYAKAASYLKQLLPITKPDLWFPSQIMQLYQLQFKVDSARANYSSALHYFQLYTALKDSLLNETTNKQMAELDIKYQTNQKEQALLLRQKDITLLTQQNTTQQTQRNAFIGGTLLLAALLGISFNRYRLKQRSNHLLLLQQEQINHKNEALQRLLGEKERLLKEIHHRVKNNLQIVMSLLNSQAASLTDQAALSAIQQSQHRVQAMALIHQKLYQSEGIARIPMADYITELVAYLHESYALPQPIRFELAIAPIELDVTQAVPLGLIINEAITNALKYAFPDSRSGVVKIGLNEGSARVYELVIADDGVGLPADFDPIQSRSLGMRLMYGFSEQLGGQLQIGAQSGLSIRLLFHDEPNTIVAYE